jgi:hypothetical protein
MGHLIGVLSSCAIHFPRVYSGVGLHKCCLWPRAANHISCGHNLCACPLEGAWDFMVSFPSVFD